MEPVEPVLKNIYQSNTSRKDLSWPRLDDEPRVPKKQQVKDQQSCIFDFVAWIAIGATRGTSPVATGVATRGRHDPDMTSPDMTRVFCTWVYGRFIEIQSNLRREKIHRTIQGSNFLGGSFSNRDNVGAPIRFRREGQSRHLKKLFFLKNRPIHFYINTTSVIRLVKWN